MSPDSLRTLIQQVIQQEISTLRSEVGAFAATKPQPQIREERVAITTNAQLMAFVQRLLEVTKEGKARREIETGRWVFRLDNDFTTADVAPCTEGQSVMKNNPETEQIARYDRGLVTEQQVASLSPSVSQIFITNRVRFTPLARDSIRRRGITIERVE